MNQAGGRNISIELCRYGNAEGDPTVVQSDGWKAIEHEAFLRTLTA